VHVADEELKTDRCRTHARPRPSYSCVATARDERSADGRRSVTLGVELRALGLAGDLTSETILTTTKTRSCTDFHRDLRAYDLGIYFVANLIFSSNWEISEFDPSISRTRILTVVTITTCKREKDRSNRAHRT
jgi:hypothetical protein